MPQQEKQQNRIEGMNDDVNQMVGTGVDTKQVTIQSMRQCGYGMPVPNDRLSEGIAHRIQRQTGTNLRILGNELWIVVENELVCSDGEV